ncbi:MAG: phosphatidylglycerol lysyltransferase domain-containing protein [Deltaproteobacteria bacterium]|jgi:hypothetical protein|nr:phosphatidylglycerol lysyltransferase domain-containing protein [Deltaproteobacteria bacterium]
MSFKPLTMADMEIFRAAEKAAPLTTSDVIFSNLLIWNDYYHFTWERLAGCLVLLASPEGQAPFALPPLGLGDRLAAAEKVFSLMSAPLMSRVPEELAQFYQAQRPGWASAPDPDNDDYVYLAEKLINLSGRRMHQKKNHYNYFRQNYEAEFEDVTPELAPELIALEDLWLTAKTEKIGPQTHLVMERRAIHLLLSNLETLNLRGLAIRVNGQIEAFTIGEVLNADTAVIHAEKGNPEIRGIYVALCSHFCRRYFSDLTYINREQDLGLPGLRFSKESLKPHHMAKKFNLTPLD